MEIHGCDVIQDNGAKNYHLVEKENSDYSSIFRTVQFDYCINFSGAAIVSDSIQNPMNDFTLNTVNVFNLINAIRTYNHECKFLNISSAAVYGNPVELPISEDHPIAPISPYGYHKRQSEIICKEFSHIYNIRTANLRIFSAYGNGLHKQLFWDLFRKQQANDHVKLFGTGKESRDFIHVHDIMQIVQKCLERLEFNGESLNVANGKEITIEYAANTFFKFFDPKIRIQFSNEVRKGDPNNWVADISKLKSLGYQQEISLEQGLTSYVEWLKGL